MVDDYSVEELRHIYDDIRVRVNSRYASRANFAGHLVAFLATAAITVTFAVLGIVPGFFTWLAPFFLAAWFIGISIHAVNWLLTELRERAIQKELERAGIGYYTRMLYERGMLEKQKRDGERLVRLTDDGEIVDLYEDEPSSRDVHVS
jgi:hypothetical protein